MQCHLHNYYLLSCLCQFYISLLISAVPNWLGFLGPWGSKTRFATVRVTIFEGESLYVLRSTFFKRKEIYECLERLLMKRILCSLIIPTNITNVTI